MYCRYTGGGTRTDLALYRALFVSFNSSSGQGARDPGSGYPRIAVILTDGDSNRPALTKVAATVVKQNGLVLFTVGLGINGNPRAVAEIRYIASYPKCMRVYYLTDFSILEGERLSLFITFQLFHLDGMFRLGLGYLLGPISAREFHFVEEYPPPSVC